MCARFLPVVAWFQWWAIKRRIAYGGWRELVCIGTTAVRFALHRGFACGFATTAARKSRRHARVARVCTQHIREATSGQHPRPGRPAARSCGRGATNFNLASCVLLAHDLVPHQEVIGPRHVKPSVNRVVSVIRTARVLSMGWYVNRGLGCVAERDGRDHHLRMQVCDPLLVRGIGARAQKPYDEPERGGRRQHI